MSPGPSSSAHAHMSFPRVSGDEPQLNELFVRAGEFSPREWG